MPPSCRIATLALLALVACAGEIETTDADLTIEQADADGLRGTLVVDSETIAVESSVANGVRTTAVTGAGAAYAVWRMALDTHEIVGEFGGVSFGRPEDHDADMDPAVWQPLAESRTGEVLEAVSAGAQGFLDGHGFPEVEDELTGLSKMAGYLRDMADLPPLPPTSDIAYRYLACDYTHGTYEVDLLFNSNADDETTCWVQSSAWTYRPETYCSRLYSVSLYSNTYGLIGTNTCDGDVCYRAIVVQPQGLGKSKNTFCRHSKHWDTYVPATWLYKCETPGSDCDSEN